LQDLKESANKIYYQWKDSAPSLFVVKNVDGLDEKVWERVYLEKYQGFIEGIIDSAVMYKDEIEHRKDLILQQQIEEEAIR
jgi:hypothetical protein